MILYLVAENEQTLCFIKLNVHYIHCRVEEIPEEFLNIPYQTMECVLFGLKPLTMLTSYFDLTTKKQ